ncbi:MAG: SDR family oxidoreductase [Bacteroidales bacterium]|nr:SDR family oxidoreductase [Bacteroidales bacterium]
MYNLSFNDLKGKVCVITGGAGILGTSISHALAASGLKLAILDFDHKKGMALANELNHKYVTDCIGVYADVLDKQSLVNAKTEINDKLGKIDFLINGAGGNAPEATTKIEKIMDDSNIEDTFFGLSMESIDKVMTLNFLGTLLPTKIFTIDMLEKKQGSIINISSMNSYRPLTKIPAYSAAKASINNFTQWLSVHLANTGIRVNAIAPGFFLTKQNEFLLIDKKSGNYSPRGKKIIENTPVARYGNPEDLHGAVLFLLSDISSFITGIVLPVDGGYSAFGGV